DGCGSVTEFGGTSPTVHENDLVHRGMPMRLDCLPWRDFLIAHHEPWGTAIAAIDLDDGERTSHDPTDPALTFLLSEDKRRPCRGALGCPSDLRRRLLVRGVGCVPRYQADRDRKHTDGTGRRREAHVISYVSFAAGLNWPRQRPES